MATTKTHWSTSDPDASRWLVFLDGERVLVPVRADVTLGLVWCYLALSPDPRALANYGRKEYVLLKVKGRVTIAAATRTP